MRPILQPSDENKGVASACSTHFVRTSSSCRRVVRMSQDGERTVGDGHDCRLPGYKKGRKNESKSFVEVSCRIYSFESYNKCAMAASEVNVHLRTLLARTRNIWKWITYGHSARNSQRLFSGRLTTISAPKRLHIRCE